MIIKGGSRRADASDISELAWHLQRLDENDSFTIRGVTGTVATDVHGAFEEMACCGAGARTQRPLYHGIINPDPRERALTEAEKDYAVERLGQELGLSDQPRIVIQHEKNGRTHLHVVWSRVDTARMVAIHDSWSAVRHEIVARELETTFGHARVQGPLVGRCGLPRPKRAPSLAEQRQADRTGVTPERATQNVTKAWNATTDGRTFRVEIEALGAMLVRADRRDYVIVDPDGEVHSLARRLPGVRAADVRTRMADLDPASLPSVREGKWLMAAKRERDHVAVMAEIERDRAARLAAEQAHRPGQTSTDDVPPATPASAPIEAPAPISHASTRAPVPARRSPAPATTITKPVELGVREPPRERVTARSKLPKSATAGPRPPVLSPSPVIPLGVGGKPPKKPPKPPVVLPPGYSVTLGVGPAPPSRLATGRGPGRGRGKHGPQR